MSLPSGDEAKLLRFALLKPSPVEIKNPMVPGYWVLGWSFQPDEHWQDTDGSRLLRVIQRRGVGAPWKRLERDLQRKLMASW